MSGYRLTQPQARVFMLVQQGLMGKHRFAGKQGIMDYLHQAGSIQYDPIDSCGRNSELVLQSRILGFQKNQLQELLYEDRLLVDYFDKNLCVIPVEDWKFFSRTRMQFQEQLHDHPEIAKVSLAILATIKEKGYVCSKDFVFDQKIDWAWGDTNLARAALEALYFQGVLVIHHKQGSIKYYSLAEDTLPTVMLHAPDPFPTMEEHRKWRILRRIRAVGMLWNQSSDAWLSIRECKSAQRNQSFDSLLQEEKIIEIVVEGIKDNKGNDHLFYCCVEDKDILDDVLAGEVFEGRMEFLAPLDGFLWDRKLIRAIFNFEYTWEIYTPEAKRLYGYYVLPILWNDTLVGRIDVVHNRKASSLVVKKIWMESSTTYSKELSLALIDCIERFRVFHGCKDTVYEDGFDLVMKQ